MAGDLLREPDEGLDELVSSALKGNRRALSRLISKVENDRSSAKEAIRKVYSKTGRAVIVGVTGPLGSGKSSLIAALAKHLGMSGARVAVLAIDPSSLFTGGALLGDRVRMRELAEDTNVFIRSMASRGYGGGLCRAAADVVRVLDAASWTHIIVETVGAGQTDLDIVELAQTVIVVLCPGAGDEIQALKAGLMEIGDIFVVNKSDLEGSNRTILGIRGMLQTYGSELKWQPPVLPTNSINGSGVAEVAEAIRQHQHSLSEKGARKGALTNGESQLLAAIRQELELELVPELHRDPNFEEYEKKIEALELDPYTAASSLVQHLRNK